MSDDGIIELRCEVRCQHCGEWFKSGIQFGDAGTFFNTSTSGNLQQCPNPNCGKMTGMNKSDMRFGERRADGRVTYVEGENTF